MSKRYRWLRHPRTTQERRLHSDPELRPYIRGKRSWKRLPNAWDDIFIPFRENESWKKLRKTQYRGGVMGIGIPS